MFCPHCGKPYAPSANFCSSCGAAVPTAPLSPETRILRPRTPRVVAGVCSGFALHFGWNANMVRLLLCVFTVLTSGLGLLCYIAAWILLPEAPYALTAGTVYTTPPPGGTQQGTSA